MRFPKFKLDSRLLIRVLWVWWLLCSVVLVSIWSVALGSSVGYATKKHEADVAYKAQMLAEAFDQLDRNLVRSILDVTPDFEAGSLTLERLEEKRRELAPLYRVHVLDARGQRLYREDSAAPFPAWMFEKIRRYQLEPNAFFTIKPREHEKERPYYFAIEPNARGEYLVIEIALDQVYGPWLSKKFKELDFGPGVTFVKVEPTIAKSEKRNPDDVNVSITINPQMQKVSSQMEALRINGLLPGNPSFHQVEIRADFGGLLKPIFKRYFRNFLGGVLFMASFAVALFLAGRGIKKELELAQARTNFTSMVSHELKTPVAAIQMYAEILENRLVEDPEKIAEYHRIIGTEAERLKRLIENLLSLGNIERGTLTYRLSPVALNAIVERAAQQASAPFAGGAEVDLRLESGLPELMLDPEMAQQALSNLIHNALKYGGRSVTVATRRSGGEVLVEVMDRGPGIPASKRKAIFDPYVRLENEATRSSQGTGLGLALVKGFVEGQGGRIAVGDRPGGGAVFTVTFPVAKGANVERTLVGG